MMEFFVSKFWAFLVSIVIMGVLFQGMQMSAQSDRGDAMDQMAKDLERLFRDFAAAGVGLERTLHLDPMLPATATLTVFQGYAVLADAGLEARFTAPITELLRETDQGSLQKVDRLVLGPFDALLMVNEASGTTLIAISP